MRFLKRGANVLALLLLLSLTACGTSSDDAREDVTIPPDTPEQNLAPSCSPDAQADTDIIPDSSCTPELYNNYRMRISYLESFPGFEHLSPYSIGVLEVFGMADTALERKINDLLYSASTSWAKGAAVSEIGFAPDIYCHTPRYLCVLTLHHYEISDFNNNIFDFITVAMLTGERIFLNDLINISDDFITLLKTQPIAQASGDEMFFDGVAENLREWLAEMPFDELKERLVECSKTQQEVIDAGYGSIEETIGPLVFRNTFYIEPGKLVLMLGGMASKVTINIEDIKDYLLVDAW